MKVMLLKNNRIDGKAGEIAEVSPARAAFLLEVGLAERIREQNGTAEKKPTKRKTAKKETAEP